MFSLKNKTVFLTGSTGGIGKEIAFQMSSLGAKMVLTGTNEEKLKDLSSKLPNENDYIVSNLNNSQNIENLSNQLKERDYSIDILINNAGITRDNLFIRMNDEHFNEVLELNLKSVFRVTKSLIKGMLKRRSGRIISISSVVGSTGNPGQVNYSASKAGIEGFTKSLAAEFAPKVRVNCIAPSLTDTELAGDLLRDDKRREASAERHPLKRIGQREDIAHFCLVLWTKLRIQEEATVGYTYHLGLAVGALVDGSGPAIAM